MRLNCIKSLKGLFLLAILLGLGTSRAQATEINAEQREYFERHIRPVLIENCYKCHGGEVEKIKGDFNLTFREGLLTSGEQGGNIVPGNPDASALIKALRYEDPDFQMPPSGKLPELVIQYFEDWIAMGAPDPRDEAFKEGDTELADIWAQTLEHRKSWWSYQPITKPVVPVLETNTSTNPIDAFIQAGWINAGVVPAEKADPYALIRRLSFVLTGLPPTQDEITTFVEAAKIDHQAAVETTVDQLLASPRFGERWARHWMDWMRYAETEVKAIRVYLMPGATVII